MVHFTIRSDRDGSPTHKTVGEHKKSLYFNILRRRMDCRLQQGLFSRDLCAMQQSGIEAVFLKHLEEGGRRQMALRWLAFAAVFLGLSPQAFGAEPPGVFRRASCAMVRYYVAKYSEQAAEQWARSKGASEADIEAARRCLKGTPVLTAQRGTD